MGVVVWGGGGRVDGGQVDREVAESVGGVVRLLRRAAQLVWAEADAQGARSARQLLALGIDVAAGEAESLLPGVGGFEGPVPVGEDPARLLRSAEELLGMLCGGQVPSGLPVLRLRVAELLWEANTGAGW
jgi:hypothetical protein